MSAHTLSAYRGLVVVVLTAFVAGCSSGPKATEAEAFFETPGRYAAAPVRAVRPRVGIPAPVIEVLAGLADTGQVSIAAADQLFWVADRSGRFNLLDRVRMAELMNVSAGAENAKPDELLHVARVAGLDYVLDCRISKLSVRGDAKADRVSVAYVEQMLRVSTAKPHITTTCQVNLRLIDPATGKAVAEVDDSFKRTCSPEAMGLSFPTPDDAWGAFQLNDEQARQVLRIVLDDALRQMLPRVDVVLTQAPAPVIAVNPSSATKPTTQASGVKPRPILGKIICRECGFEASTADQFCPNCGARLTPPGAPANPPGK